MCIDTARTLIKNVDSGSGDLGWGGLRFLISNKLLGDPDAAQGFGEQWDLGKVFLPEAESEDSSQSSLSTVSSEYLALFTERPPYLQPNIHK